MVNSRLRVRKVPGSKPDSNEDQLCMGYVPWLYVKPCVVTKRPPSGVVRKFREGVPAQISSASSDRSSKLRGPSQNRPRVASERDVNISKPKYSIIIKKY
uniref:Uncharacterized protein n=2 Tax=Araneus ventricosus TaxID=182803 RepID=A0A4Y2R2I0_ARAVE|nr:hypothetical protein AVEN_261974-1 [Araneus ventricosus]GBN69877.1 hypothetical protein AVEN_23279-1 [Araneus ventricosus]GBN69939.1 hypothetical protein AVEN_217920-1 [Araneus ventricosus]